MLVFTRIKKLNPKYIFIAFFSVASFLFFTLPQVSQTQVAPASVSGPGASPVRAAALPIQSPEQITHSGNQEPQVLVKAPPTQDDTRSASIPLTSNEHSTLLAMLPDLASFSASVVNSNPNVLVGVYVPGLFALPVVQQPDGNNDFVAPSDFTLTQYAAPAQYGSIAILAHNYLSGRSFFQLRPGQEFVLVYGDGSLKRFQIQDVHSYQALDSNNPYSDFIDLSDPTGRVMPFTTIFERFYTYPGKVVFQTCIDSNGDPSWGRLFIVANPL
jgi:hypothetical protein